MAEKRKMVRGDWGAYLAFWPFPRGRANLQIDAADACRDRRDWSNAAKHYRRAVTIQPARRPIWVQLGHAEKEAGRLPAAFDAYRKAAAIPGDDGDAPLHLGAAARLIGDMALAKAAFLQALRENPGHEHARRELLHILHHPLAVSAGAREKAAMLCAQEAERLAGAPPQAQPAATIIFDASDLVGYFRHSRLPTGIQRVQMEVIRSAIKGDPRTQIVCFADDHGMWQRIPAAHFAHICELAVANGDTLEPGWITAMEVLTAALDRMDTVGFAQGGVLVNLGTSWWLLNYFLYVREAQRRHGIHYVPFVHDFIPVMAPQHCVRELTQDFLSWTFGVFRHADFFLANSRSTQADLEQVANTLGYQVGTERVAVIPLDADFRQPDMTRLPEAELARWQLAPGDFVLFVSTIESRKNHLQAFAAWEALIARHGAEALPDLVCVGNRGWLNDHVYARLEESPALAAKVRMLSRLSDAELALLYRHCRFTVYPSTYEGWGLPVTEALCHGKVVVLSRCSSLPEAGGDFGVYVAPGDLAELTAAVEAMCFDHAARAALEDRIRREFRPRQWQDIAHQIHDELRAFMARANGSADGRALPAVAFNRLYRFTRNRQTRLVRGADEGEALRYGVGWWQLEDWGCWSRPEGGELAFTVPAGCREVRCFLRLRGPLGRASDVVITPGEKSFQATLLPGQWRWISFPAAAVDGRVGLTITGELSIDMNAETDFRDRRRIGAGLGGLVVTAGDGAQTLPDVARLAAEADSGAYTFLRDAYPLLTNRDLDETALQDYLLALESGGMSRLDVVAALRQSVDGEAAAREAMQFP